VPEPREISFRSQQDFRRQLADQVPVRLHEIVKIAKRGEYVNCKGLRYRDRLKKRQVLSEIAANQGRESSRHESFYRCKQCDVHLCKKRPCFDVFH
jgi:hypothetical protein